MTLSETARNRLADIVALQPTKNGELQDQWRLDSGSEVHQYLEAELSEYYYRDENSLIRATEEAAELVDVDPSVETNDEQLVVRVPQLHERILSVLARPDERAESVVSVLHSLRAEYDIDPSTDEIRRALQRLRDQGAVEVVQRSVQTFKRAADDDTMTVEVRE